MNTQGKAELKLLPSGIPTLDSILGGGFPRDEMHLIHGTAGTGKTTIALSYLGAGAAAGEPGLYVTLSQSKSHLERIAQSHGWSMEGITVHELTPRNLAERLAGRQSRPLD